MTATGRCRSCGQGAGMFRSMAGRTTYTAAGGRKVLSAERLKRRSTVSSEIEALIREGHSVAELEAGGLTAEVLLDIGATHEQISRLGLRPRGAPLVPQPMDRAH